jgi:hypothetical protein
MGGDKVRFPAPQFAATRKLDLRAGPFRVPRMCRAPTAEQQAISSCGMEASDATQQQRAKSYCDAPGSKGRGVSRAVTAPRAVRSAALNARR